MSATHSEDEETKQVTVRVDTSTVDDVDDAILRAKADGKLPRDYSRSDALRDVMEQLSEDLELLSDYEADDE